jgi:protein-S-isoprenylcysteine O-methyltransferase Ste14
MDIIEHQQEEFKEYRKGMVHFILVHSYLIFLFAVVLGVLFDVFLNGNIFSGVMYQYVGLLMLIAGSLIIYWAQSTSANYKKRIKKNETMLHFEFGPYKYFRSPTHFGLFVMTLGLALIINSLFSVIFTVLAYTITKLFFLKKEEKLLEEKYGETYTNYKKKVKNWV